MHERTHLLPLLVIQKEGVVTLQKHRDAAANSQEEME